jgi:hypothetical protein
MIVNYNELWRAYFFFRTELFKDALPPSVLIEWQTRESACSYIKPDGGTVANQMRIALPLEHVTGRQGDEILSFIKREEHELLSMLVHQMVHLWQHIHLHPLDRACHGERWATQMQDIGLRPIVLDERSANDTTREISHQIVPNGLYAQAYARFRIKRLARYLGEPFTLRL